MIDIAREWFCAPQDDRYRYIKGDASVYVRYVIVLAKACTLPVGTRHRLRASCRFHGTKCCFSIEQAKQETVPPDRVRLLRRWQYSSGIGVE